MVDTAEVQHGRVEVMDMHLLAILDVAIAEFIGFAIGQAAFNATASQPDRERIDMMVAPEP